MAHARSWITAFITQLTKLYYEQNMPHIMVLRAENCVITFKYAIKLNRQGQNTRTCVLKLFKCTKSLQA